MNNTYEWKYLDDQMMLLDNSQTPERLFTNLTEQMDRLLTTLQTNQKNKKVFDEVKFQEYIRLFNKFKKNLDKMHKRLMLEFPDKDEHSSKAKELLCQLYQRMGLQLTSVNEKDFNNISTLAKDANTVIEEGNRQNQQINNIIDDLSHLSEMKYKNDKTHMPVNWLEYKLYSEYTNVIRVEFITILSIATTFAALGLASVLDPVAVALITVLLVAPAFAMITDAFILAMQEELTIDRRMEIENRVDFNTGEEQAYEDKMAGLKSERSAIKATSPHVTDIKATMFQAPKETATKSPMHEDKNLSKPKQ